MVDADLWEGEMTTGLEEALYRTLVTAGDGVLSEPKRLLSYVLDICDEDSIEVRVFERNCDRELLAPFVEDCHAAEGDQPGYPTAAVARARQVLEYERGIGAAVAEGVCTGLGNALARYWQGQKDPLKHEEVPTVPQGANIIAPTQVVPVPISTPTHEEPVGTPEAPQVVTTVPDQAPVTLPSPAPTQRVPTPLAPAPTPTPTPRPIPTPQSALGKAQQAPGKAQQKRTLTFAGSLPPLICAVVLFLLVAFALRVTGNGGALVQPTDPAEKAEPAIEGTEQNEAEDVALEEASSPDEDPSTVQLPAYDEAKQNELMDMLDSVPAAPEGEETEGVIWGTPTMLFSYDDGGMVAPGWVSMDSYMGGQARCVYTADEVIREIDGAGYLLDAVTIDMRSGDSIDFFATFEFFDEEENSLGSVTYANYGIANGQKTFIHATSEDVGAEPYAAKTVIVTLRCRHSETKPLADGLTWGTWNYFEGTMTISVHNWSDDTAHVTGALMYHETPGEGWGIQGTGDIDTVVAPHESADIVIRAEGWPELPDLNYFLYGYMEG